MDSLRNTTRRGIYDYVEHIGSKKDRRLLSKSQDNQRKGPLSQKNEFAKGSTGYPDAKSIEIFLAKSLNGSFF